MTAGRVLVVGDANPDLMLRGDVVPRFGQSEQLLDAADLVIGGSGAIVAHGLARLGLACTMVAVIGDDAFGELIRRRLEVAGVDVSRLQFDAAGAPTGLSVILNHGDTRTILTLTGAIGSLHPATVGDDLLARTRHLHVSSFYLQPEMADGLADLFARAQADGISTSLDTNIDPAGVWAGLDDVLPVTDVLFPNRAEILGLARRFGLGPVASGTSARTADAAESGASSGTAVPVELVRAARMIAALGPQVVVKNGEHGAFAVGGPNWDGAVLSEPAYPVEAIDTTGAGDSFDAGFIAARLDGRSLQECLALACRAGSMSTLGIGGTARQATWSQLGVATGGPAAAEGARDGDSGTMA